MGGKKNWRDYMLLRILHDSESLDFQSKNPNGDVKEIQKERGSAEKKLDAAIRKILVESILRKNHLFC